MCLRKALKIIVVIIIVLLGYPVAITKAAETADVTVTATPNPSGLACPTGLTLVDYGVEIHASWNSVANATGYELYVSLDEYPTNRTDYLLAYNGTGTSVNLTGYDLQDYRYYFTVWAYNAIGYTPCYDIEHIRNNGMELIAFIAIPVLLFIGFIFSRNAVIGWVAVIFWAVAAGYAYIQSDTPETQIFDIYYGLMWGSVAALIACALYAFAIGRKEDEDEDERPDDTPYIDEQNRRATIISRIQQKRRNKNLEKRINR